MPAFVVYAGFIYYAFGLHGAKWRFTSLPDLRNIVRASSVLAISLLALDYVLVSPLFYGEYFFGKITILLYWFLQMAFLAGSRVAYRHFRYVRTQQHHARDGQTMPTLVLGRAADAEVLLRAIESGAVTRVRPIGILSPSIADRGQTVRGIPVVGGLEDLEQIVRDAEERGTRVARLIFTPSALVPEVAPETVLMRARRLGLQTNRMPTLDDGGEAMQLAPVAVEDLLLRPSVKIDYQRLEHFIRGKSVIVTGGGGSIGAEICDRVIAFGAARLMVVEHSEVALHTVVETLKAMGTGAEIDSRIADVRDRERIFGVFAEFKPDIVFHAAALKHVPLLERDWGEGIKTNVFGSVNVADAAAAAGVTAMVMISTDKAIEPVSVLGATKRFAEMYCQALDADFARRAASAARDAADCGAFRQCARLERLGRSEVQAADRGGRAGDRHASRHGALLHDHPGSVRSRGHGGEPRARAGARRRLGVCAEHGPARAHHGARRTHDTALGPGARQGHQDRDHRRAAGRAAQRNPVRSRTNRPRRSESKASWRRSRAIRRSKQCAAGSRRWSKVWHATIAR